MKTENLIESLTQDLKPVRPMAVGRLTAVALISAAVVVAMSLLVFRPRADVSVMMTGVAYLIEFILPVLTFVVSAFLIDRLSIPGRSGRVGPAVGLWIALVGFTALQISAGDMAMGMEASGMKCTIVVVLVALLPSLILLGLARRRAVTRPMTVGLLIALTGLAAGMTEICLHCPSNNAVHVEFYHVILPLVLGVVAGLVAVQRALRW